MHAKKVSYKIEKSKLTINIQDFFSGTVDYGLPLIKKMGVASAQALAENFAYCRTRPLGLYFPKMHYEGVLPVSKKLVDSGIKKDLARISFMTDVNLSNLRKKMFSARLLFAQNKINNKILPQLPTQQEKTILSLSFGKDSLLSYALAKELNLKITNVFISEAGIGKGDPEYEFKIKIIKQFSREQKEAVLIIKDSTDDFFDKKKIPEMHEDLAGANAMFAFTLEIIPVAFANQAKYIILGNEKNLDDYLHHSQHERTYPSFDQSAVYMKQENKNLKKLTNGSIQAISLIKPLYNIAEVQILNSRYPHLLKYSMSCSSDHIKNQKWCCACVSCSWGFLYTAALGFKAELVGLQNNLFDKKYFNLYSIFNNTPRSIYEKPVHIQEEQKLAFLLACQNGAKGYAIDLFKKKFLKKTQKQEKKLRKKFFSTYSMEQIPAHLRSKLKQIFNQELKDLK